jgi:hypothetical protein
LPLAKAKVNKCLLSSWQEIGLQLETSVQAEVRILPCGLHLRVGFQVFEEVFLAYKVGRRLI